MVGLRHTQKEYWLQKGFNEEEALDKINSFYKNRSAPSYKEMHNEDYADLDSDSQENKLFVRTYKRREKTKGFYLKKEDFIQYCIKQDIVKDLDIAKSNSLIFQEIMFVYEEFEGFSVQRGLLHKFIRQASKSSPKETKINKDYWDIRGFKEKECVQQISIEQKKRSFLSETYYLKKGFSKEEAKSCISKLQKKNAIKAVRSGNGGSYSKESILFFEKWLLPLFSKNKILWKESELMLTYKEDSFFYDFCVPEYKLIVEYHGTAFHPNPLKIKEKENWRSALSKKSYEKCLQRDIFKEDLAKKNGCKIFIVWSDFSNKEKEEIVQRIRDYCKLG